MPLPRHHTLCALHKQPIGIDTGNGSLSPRHMPSPYRLKGALPAHSQVANPREILHFQKTKIKRKERQAAGSFEQQTSDARAAEDEEDPSTTVSTSDPLYLFGLFIAPSDLFANLGCACADPASCGAFPSKRAERQPKTTAAGGAQSCGLPRFRDERGEGRNRQPCRGVAQARAGLT